MMSQTHRLEIPLDSWDMSSSMKLQLGQSQSPSESTGMKSASVTPRISPRSEDVVLSTLTLKATNQNMSLTVPFPSPRPASMLSPLSGREVGRGGGEGEKGKSKADGLSLSLPLSSSSQNNSGSIHPTPYVVPVEEERGERERKGSGVSSSFVELSRKNSLAKLALLTKPSSASSLSLSSSPATTPEEEHATASLSSSSPIDDASSSSSPSSSPSLTKKDRLAGSNPLRDLYLGTTSREKGEKGKKTLSESVVYEGPPKTLDSVFGDVPSYSRMGKTIDSSDVTRYDMWFSLSLSLSLSVSPSLSLSPLPFLLLRLLSCNFRC